MLSSNYLFSLAFYWHRFIFRNNIKSLFFLDLMIQDNGLVVVTWWLWYIWSHIVCYCLQKNHTVIIIDNLSHWTLATFADIKQASWKTPICIEWNCNDKSIWDTIYKKYYAIDVVFHCAHTSFDTTKLWDNFKYYQNNIHDTIAMLQYSRARISPIYINISSADMYDTNMSAPPYTETDPIIPHNPFATSKRCIELIFQDLANYDTTFSCSLRISQIIGAHKSWHISFHKQTPQNIVQSLFAVTIKGLTHVDIYGNTHDTTDWTSSHNFLHIQDFCNGAYLAFTYLRSIRLQYEQKHMYNWLHEIINIWWIHNNTAMELLSQVESITDCEIPYIISREPSPLTINYEISIDKAQRLLGRTIENTIHTALQDQRKSMQEL